MVILLSSSFFLSFQLHFYYLLRLTFVNNKVGEIDNLSDSLGAKLVVSCVQVQVNSPSAKSLAPLPPSCCLRNPTGDINLGIFTKGNLLLSAS